MTESQAVYWAEDLGEMRDIVAEKWRRVDWNELDPRLVPGVLRYLVYGVTPGGFLTSVLENDLSAAVGRADGESLAKLRSTMQFVICFLPDACHGKRETVEKWAESGGILGGALEKN